jgi:hypothetical protein
MSDQPSSTAPTDEEILKASIPTVVELQRLLVDRLRSGRLKPEGGEMDIVSLTSCTHHSC